MDQPTEAVVQEAPVQEVSPVPADPFSLEEERLASLSPEQRAALDPVFEEWKTKAKTEMDKRSKTYEEKYKPHAEKAEALDKLVQDPRFRTWWQNITSAGVQSNPQAAGAISGAKPQDFASPEEWQNAMAEAYGGDPTKLKDIQSRMFSVMATPVIQQLRQGQEELRATIEMKDLFERHADAKELDLIGRDPNDSNDKTESLLESCLEWADKNGRPLEEGYMRARKWADSLKMGAQKQAMGLVQDKKSSVTSGPSTNKESQSVVEVADADELMSRNMDYIASGKTPPKFVIRKQAEITSGNRWSQRS